MYTLLLFVSIIFLIVFLGLRIKYPGKEDELFDAHSFFTFMSWISGLVFLYFVISICLLSTEVATEITIDNKILMYQEENANIERDIDKIVKQYLEHENTTFTNLKTEESLITLVTLFPELKSDTLVQQQIEIYTNNNAQIKMLKEQKINIITKKWLLYFGK